jgi:hypothetical protein
MAEKVFLTTLGQCIFGQREKLVLLPLYLISGTLSINQRHHTVKQRRSAFQGIGLTEFPQLDFT